MSLDQRRFSIGDITLNLHEAGKGDLILFFHGITANGGVWEPILLDLARDYHVVGVDQRGHGRSDKPPSGYDAANFAGDVVGLAKALSDRPALVVGHSLGARNAIVALAGDSPALRGAIAIDFTPFIETEVFDALDARVNGGDRLFTSRGEISAYLSDRYPLLPADAVERRSRYGYAEVPGGFRPLADAAAMTATSTGLRADLATPLKKVGKPLLLMRGALSKLVTEAAFAKTRELRPDLACQVVPDVDHYVPEEAPGFVARAIREFATAL
jgi:2-(acetamidomethylene)succinate hydrolase